MLLTNHKNPNLLLSSNSRRNSNDSTTFFKGRTISDIQRQVSQNNRDAFLQRKYSNPKYVKRIVLAYRNMTSIYRGLDTNGKMNHTMRHGLPSKDQMYIVSQYDKLVLYMRSHKKDRPNSITRKLADRLSFVLVNTNPKHWISKGERYNRLISVPEPKRQEEYNGGRIHIPLSEVL